MKSIVLSKDWIKLFRDVVFFVTDDVLSNADDDVRISFAVDVSRMQVNCLQQTRHAVVIVVSRAASLSQQLSTASHFCSLADKAVY